MKGLKIVSLNSDSVFSFRGQVIPSAAKDKLRASGFCVDALLQRTRRKWVEAVGPNLEEELPASIHAVTAEGFEM